MIEDIRRRRQERIRDIIMAEEMNQRSHMMEGSVSKPIDEGVDRTEILTDYSSAPTVYRDGEHCVDHDPKQDDLHDPERQWKISSLRWNERYGWEDHPVGGNTAGHSLRTRLLISILLFATVYGITLFPVEWSAPMRAWIHASLNDEMDMRPIAAWYEQTFSGTPVFFPLFPKQKESARPVQALHSYPSPLKGKIVRPFAWNMENIAIAPDDPGSTAIEIYNIATGKIEKVTSDEKRGITVTIQHADGLVTLYGGLASSTVQKDDWVEAGDAIGTIQGKGQNIASGDDPVLTFSMQQRGAYLDPVDVIRLD